MAAGRSPGSGIKVVERALLVEVVAQLARDGYTVRGREVGIPW